MAACLSPPYHILNQVPTSDEKWVLYETPKRSRHRLSSQDQGCGCGGSGTFSVEAEARKIHRFRIGGKNGKRKEIGSTLSSTLSFVEERIGGA